MFTRNNPSDKEWLNIENIYVALIPKAMRLRARSTTEVSREDVLYMKYSYGHLVKAPGGDWFSECPDSTWINATYGVRSKCIPNNPRHKW